MTAGLFFVGGMSLLLGALGYFPRPSEAERDSERRSWSPSEPMSDMDRVFRQRADLLSRAAPFLLTVGVVALAAGVASAMVS